MSYLHITVAFVVLAACSTQGVNMKAPSQKKILCHFAGKEYSPGDLWYPPHDSYCIQCSCLMTGKLNCTNQECPPDCPSSGSSSSSSISISSNNNNNGNKMMGEHPCCKSCSDVDSNPHHHHHRQQQQQQQHHHHHGSSSSILPSPADSSSGSGSSSSAGGGSGGSGSENGAAVSHHQQQQQGGQQHQQQSGEEDEDDESFVTENSEFVSCLHQGKIYRDGDSFTANVSGLPISAVGQCMQCVCQSGMVLCQMKSCSSFKCSSATSSSPTTTSDTCCQRCSAWRSSGGKQGKFGGGRGGQHGDDDHKFSVTTSDHNKDSKDGIPSISIPIQQMNHNNFNDNNNNNNNSPLVPIHPESSISFRDFGQSQNLPSNSATTNGNGNGNGRDGSKRQQQQQQVDDCISGGRFYMHGSSWHPVIGPFGVMECVVCKCNLGQIDCGRLKCPAKKDMPCSKPAKVEGHCCPICTSTASAQEGSKMCVSSKQDLTAFRSHGFDANGTEYIQFGFVKQRQNSEPQVDQHEWALRDGEILQFTTRYMTSDEFLNLRSRQIFVLLGATNEKNLEKFTRREKKLEKRCSSRCSVRISGLERSLRIHRLTSRKQCLTHERAVST